MSDFVSRVEERSSLLSLSGHILEDGQLRATYEFKHLTFQEYLAALAAANGYYPDRREGEQLADVLVPYLTKSSWREVVPLAGVLGGRYSGALVERIIEMIGPEKDYLTVKEKMRRPELSLIGLLSTCLADDVPLGPDLLKRAIEIILTQSPRSSYEEIFGGRYGPEIYEVARAGYQRFDDFASSYGSALAQARIMELGDLKTNATEFFQEVRSLINSTDPMKKAEGSLVMMRTSWRHKGIEVRIGGKGKIVKKGESDDLVSKFASIRTAICAMLEKENDPRVLLAGFWALCWLTEIKRVTPRARGKIDATTLAHMADQPKLGTPAAVRMDDLGNTKNAARKTAR